MLRVAAQVYKKLQRNYPGGPILDVYVILDSLEGVSGCTGTKLGKGH